MKKIKRDSVKRKESRKKNRYKMGIKSFESN
jgi:hypothetical protein